MKLFSFHLIWREQERKLVEPYNRCLFAESREDALQIIANSFYDQNSHEQASERWKNGRYQVWLVESAESTDAAGMVTWLHKEAHYELLPPPEPIPYLRDFEMFDIDGDVEYKLGDWIVGGESLSRYLQCMKRARVVIVNNKEDRND